MGLSPALMELVQLYRIVWISGRLGFGKTALAFAIARELFETGMCDGVVSNCPNILPVSRDGIDDGTISEKACVYDEAWSDLDSRTSMTNSRGFGAFARKLNIYWLFPSVHPIDRRLRAVTIAPEWTNAFTGVTHWSAFLQADKDSGNTSDRVKFSFDPKTAYGIYSTSYIPIDDCGLGDRFNYSHFLETGVWFGDKEDATRRRIDQEEQLLKAGVEA